MTEIEDRIKRLSEPFDARFIQQKPGPGGRRMDFVSHGTVTKRLNERAPGWSSRIVASGVDVTQNPKGGLLYTADVTLELTVAGVTRAEVGTNNQPVADRGQALKSAASDALKRAAMRFGVALDLWESLDEQDEDAQYATTPRAGSAGPGREAPAPRGAPQRPAPAPRAPAEAKPAGAPPRTVGDRVDTPCPGCTGRSTCVSEGYCLRHEGPAAERARTAAAPTDRPAAVPGAAGPPSPANGKPPPTMAQALAAALDGQYSARARLRAATLALEAAPMLDDLADVYHKVMALPERDGLKETYERCHAALKAGPTEGLAF